MRRPVVATPEQLTNRFRTICSDFPEVTERLSHGAPTWFVRGKRSFVMLWPRGHHDHAFPHLWCAAPPGAQEAMIAHDGDRFFRPPYVGHRGWLGVRLDGKLDWDELEGICEDAYRVIAPPVLTQRLDAGR